MSELIRFLATLCTAGAAKENVLVLVLARDRTATGRGAEAGSSEAGLGWEACWSGRREVG